MPQAVVVTDFDVHALWLLRDVERYFVAREEAAAYLEQQGQQELLNMVMMPFFVQLITVKPGKGSTKGLPDKLFFHF